jgi:hypothetical protein
MATWRDGMGRTTIKVDTGDAEPGSLFQSGGMLGIVRRKGWLFVYGPVRMNVVGVGAYDDTPIREKARKHHAQRHGPRHLRDRGYGPNWWLDEADAEPSRQDG